MDLTILLILFHAATALLHAYLALHTFRDRQVNFQLSGFWMFTGLCAVYHCLILTEYYFNQTPWQRQASVVTGIVPVLLAPMTIPMLISELTQLPARANIIARLLHPVALHAKFVFYLVMGCAVVILFLQLNAEKILDWGFSFEQGRPDVAAYFFLSSSFLWIAMMASGLRSSQGALAISRYVSLTLMVTFIVVLLLAVGIPRLSSVATFLTIPIALIFAWYRLRLELIDVISRQFVRWTVTLLAVWVVFFKLWDVLEDDGLSDASALIIILIFAGMIRLLEMLIDRLMDRLWMPVTFTNDAFSNQFRQQLGQCETPAAAIDMTETVLSKLFKTSVRYNHEVSEQAQIIEISCDPARRLHLGYIRGWIPWFSRALDIVRAAGGFLEAHFKVLEMMEEKHKQAMVAQEMAELAAKAQLVAMRAQIRPHFLFNVLNTVHNFVREDPGIAEHTIELLSDLMRGALQSAEQDTYPLGKELELARTYLQIEKIRYGDRLSFRIDATSDAERCLVPAFSLQPLVENAVKHAVDKNLGITSIDVKAVLQDNSLRISVSDDGPGFDRSFADDKHDANSDIDNGNDGSQGGLGIAMSNIRERLQRLYAGAASLTLEGLPAGGVRSSLNIPIHLAMDNNSQS